jgi:hypothetical protein
MDLLGAHCGERDKLTGLLVEHETVDGTVVLDILHPQQ